MLTDKELMRKVDHTNLDSTAPWSEIKRDADFAVNNGCASLCVAPYYIAKLREAYGDKLTLCTVIGFPRGDATTATKVFEATEAVKNGAKEIDVVANISEIKNGNFDIVLDDLIAVRRACENAVMKVIIETYFLTDEEIAKMTKAVASSGANYIKTCTANISGGATKEAVRIIVDNLSNGLKIKVSGGVKTRTAAEEFIAMGADRIGTKFTADFLKKEQK